MARSERHEVVWRRWDAPLNEMTETYTFGNGWGVEVVTDLSMGVVDASSSVQLLEVAASGVCWAASTVPPAPSRQTAPMWFTDRGASPGVVNGEGLRRLCTLVAWLPARLELGTCAWFAGCGRRAVRTVTHPSLGDVPVCGECSEFANG